MASNARFMSVLISDDCRKEDNGKDIAIGIYTGSIISSAIPIVLPTLALRFEVVPAKNKYDNVIVFVKKPDGNDLAHIKASLEFKHANAPGAFFLKFGPVSFDVEGTYRIFLGMDEEAEPISEFIVRIE